MIEHQLKKQKNATTKSISSGRKIAYYAGWILIMSGAISFFSIFFIVATTSGEPTSAMLDTFPWRAFGGMVLIVLGSGIRLIGARGLAGSGVLLDPQRARGELKPYTQMAGGMLKDALDEAEINLAKTSLQVVMIKCRDCGKLNAEDAKFCQQCGKQI